VISYGEKLLNGGIGLELNWLQSLFLGLISGIAEVLPVSAQAHRLVLLKIFGMKSEPAVLRLMIHVSTAVALYLGSRAHIVRMMRAFRISKIPKKRRKRPLDTEGLNDFNLLRTTLIPTILAFMIYSKTSMFAGKALIVSALMVINGIILYVPQYLPGSNKESGSMSRIDGLVIGLGAASGTLPGISSVGTAVSVAAVRGMDLKKALNLALLMNIPVNLGMVAYDLISLLSGGAGSLSLGALGCGIMAGITAFAGVIIGLRLIRKIVENVGYSVFGFYSWGAALLSFVLFLAVV
jgi:undecaprenyl-diphosphatase